MGGFHEFANVISTGNGELFARMISRLPYIILYVCPTHHEHARWGQQAGPPSCIIPS